MRRRSPRAALRLKPRPPRPHRHLRRAPDPARDRIWLYPRRRRDRARNFRGREIRREARCQDGRALRRRGLSVELRQLHVPRQFLLDEYQLRAGERACGHAGRRPAGTDLGFVTLDPEAFAAATAKSIDYAVMEHTTRAAVMPVAYGWSDVGSWQAVWELSASTPRQRRPGRGGVRRYQRLAMWRATGNWWRCSVSTMSS